jgi:signal transduction histidine kinase
MKPLMSESSDAEALQELGRASVQIVHDLKNQINGLKLYATFLRKRLEKTDGRADELETVNKLLAGLERTAADMTTLVRYGRPVELRRVPHTDLRRVLVAALEREPEATGVDTCPGEFDQAALTEALKQIDVTLAAPNPNALRPAVGLRYADADGTRFGVIEWRGLPPASTDLFNSFAGGQGLRLALAAKIIRAHGGQIEHAAGAVRVRIPIKSSDK